MKNLFLLLALIGLFVTACNEGGVNEEEADDRIGVGAIIAIVVGAVLVVGGGGFAIYWFVIKKKNKLL